MPEHPATVAAILARCVSRRRSAQCTSSMMITHRRLGAHAAQQIGSQNPLTLVAGLVIHGVIGGAVFERLLQVEQVVEEHAPICR